MSELVGMGIDIRPLTLLAPAPLDVKEEERLALARLLLAQSGDEIPAAFEALVKGDPALMTGEYALSSLEDFAPDLVTQAQGLLATNSGLMAAMLLMPAHRYETLPDFVTIAPQLLPLYAAWRIAYALVFIKPGELQQHSTYIDRTIAQFYHGIVETPPSDRTMVLANAFVHKFNPLSFCNNDDFHVQAYQQKALIEEFYLRRTDLKLLHVFPERETSGKLKVGVITEAISPNNDSYYVLSFVEKLPRDCFDLTLYYSVDASGPFPAHLKSLFDRIVKIESVNDAAAIRADNLDVLLCGSFKGCFFSFLPNHMRHARLQLMTPAVPNTTGYANWDVFLTGSNEAPGDIAPRYSEEVLQMGSMINYNAFGHDPQPRTLSVTRADLRLPDGAILFVSNASLYKFSPELVASWARIMAAVPGSQLLLMPFGITWRKQPPAIFRMLRDEFQRHGISFDRVHLQLAPFAVRRDIQAVLEICDVYLDSYPFSGGASMTDPLEVNLPVAARNGATLRGRLGGPMLGFIGLEELVTANEADYEALAIRLAKDKPYRDEIRARMKASLAGGLPYYETETPSRQIAEAVSTLWDRRNSVQKSLRAMPSQDLHHAIVQLAQKFRAANNQLFASLGEGEIMRLILLPCLQARPSFTTSHIVHLGAGDGMFCVPFLMQGWTADLIEPSPEYSQMLDAIAAATGNARLTKAPLADLRLDHLAQIDVLAADTARADLPIVLNHDFARMRPDMVVLRIAPASAVPPEDQLTALLRHGYHAMVIAYDETGAPIDVNFFVDAFAPLAISNGGTIIFFTGNDLPAILLTLLESFLPGSQRNLTRLT